MKTRQQRREELRHQGLPQPSLPWLYLIPTAVLIFAVGFGVAWYTSNRLTSSGSSSGFLREKGDYTFVSPLLACGLNDKKTFAEYAPLKNILNGLISQYQSEHKTQNVSVYFRNLNTGRWMGINQDELYAPASLYKVTLLMAYLKEAEGDPAILDKQVFYPGSTEGPDGAEDVAPMTPGKTYTVRQLLEHLIIYSDNDAKDLLHNTIDQNSVNDVFSDLGLHVPGAEDTGDSMSAKDYSLFFRILYNATYLNRDMSEYALNLLSQTKFSAGIQAGIPASTAVAHKFGYRIVSPPEDGVTRELHDCGIVYAPSGPYFVCVMTKGWDPTDLESVISGISKAVYAEVSSH